MIIEMTALDLFDVVRALHKTLTNEAMKNLTDQELSALSALVEATQKSLASGGQK